MVSENAQAGLETILMLGAMFAGLGWIASFGILSYRALETDEIRWPFVWSILTFVVLAGSILGLVIL